MRFAKYFFRKWKTNLENVPFSGDWIIGAGWTMEEDFFAVADRLCDLYITYRERYVVMQPAPDVEAGYRIYMPKSSTGPVKLSNRVVCRHLNRRLALSVFAGMYSSKFICFDVDLPEQDEVWLTTKRSFIWKIMRCRQTQKNETTEFW